MIALKKFFKGEGILLMTLKKSVSFSVG